jgi:hypothetical protein
MKEYNRDSKGRFLPKKDPSSVDETEETPHPLIKFFEDLDFKEEDKPEQREEQLKKVLGIGTEDMKPYICSWLKLHAEELTLQLTNIAPYGNYEKLIEDNDGMADFLKDESSKVENWKSSHFEPADKESSLIKFTFHTDSVDTGETLKGLAFVSLSGAVRHAFVVIE